MAPNPVPVAPPANPAYAKQGDVPSPGSSQGKSFSYAGIPQDFLPESGKLPKQIKNPTTGAISYTYYDLNLDSNVIYQAMSPELRKKVFDGLARKDGSSSSNRNSDKEKSLLSDLLLYANIAGLPWQTAYEDYMKKLPDSTGSKKAPSVRVTSTDDLDVVFRKTAQELLGYELPPEVAQRFGKAYNQLEIAEGRQAAAGGVYQAAAAPGTVAEQQIRKQFGAEVTAVQAGDFAQIMSQRIKELGA